MSRASPPPARSSAKKRISKDEKICQLKSDLKLSQEKNARLKKELERLKSGESAAGGNSRTSNRNENTTTTSSKQEEQQKKFREAARAMKKVTVGQEMIIRKLKSKAQDRRKEIKQRDTKIAALEQKLASIERTEKMLKGTKGDKELHAKVRELQLALDESTRRKNYLEELLDEKESKMEAVQKQRNSLLSPQLQKMKNQKSGYISDGNTNLDSSASVGSGQSGSTAGEFEVAKLKKELAKKSDKIMKLEMDLEMVQDELHDMSQKKMNSGDAFGGGAATGGAVLFPPPSSFMVGRQQQRRQQQESGMSADDWTEIDDTDCESEFGESFFDGKKEDEDDDFW